MVWNGTVANLTLMALGSSAPEILLSIIELIGGDFYSGPLGASTIVGSAAFNLFCIIAVCVIAIPAGQVRYIRDTSVFFVTSVSGIFAYVWLLMIVAGPWSKDYIEIWEGVLTFLFFPVLVIVAFMADKGYFSQGGTVAKAELKRITLEAAAIKDIAAMDKEIRRKYGEQLSDDEVARIMEAEYGGPVSRAAYRIGAIRSIVGGKRVHLRKSDAPSHLAIMPAPEAKSEVQLGQGVVPEEGRSIIEFVSEAYSVGEACGTVEIGVRRRGGAAAQRGTVKVRFKTRDGDAKSGQDYEAAEGELVFPPLVATDPSAAYQDSLKVVPVKIINDRDTEQDECFYIELLEAISDDPKVKCTLGTTKQTTVKIIDDDLAGELRLEEAAVSRKEELRDFYVNLKVKRTKGCRGTISCKWRTEDDTAVQPVDYEAASGDLVFTDGQESNSVSILVKSTGRYDDSDVFRVILCDPEGTKFDAGTDGGEEQDICYITITPDQEAKDQVDHVFKLMKSKMAKAQVGHSNWKSQFIDAILVGGGGDDEGEDVEKPGVKDWVMHIITVLWKVLFAFIPPTDYCGGWLSFCIALVFIGGVTALIGDLAALLGCVWGIPDAITAVTFVALGTSLPDTFASKSAAVQDEFADNSVGNVTGSNSVNVFLGIGLPWMIGAFFWSSQGKDKDEARYTEWVLKYNSISAPGSTLTTDAATKDGNVFVVLSGSLTLCVITFCALACVCMAVLIARRMTPSIGGELGGPALLKYATSIFLVVLWIIFLIVYIVATIDNMADCDYTTALWD
jgi:solute carrier family 8 (sodium/calcium exchanger)